MKYSHHESPEIEVPSEVNEIIPLTLEDENKIKSALLALYYRKHHEEYNEDTEFAEHTWNDAFCQSLKSL